MIFTNYKFTTGGIVHVYQNQYMNSNYMYFTIKEQKENIRLLFLYILLYIL